MNKLLSVVMGLALGGFLLALPGCACWTDAAKMTTPGCVIAHALVDCTVDGAKSYGPAFVPIIANLIAGNPGATDWDAIKKAAESMGIKDGGCFLADLKNLLFNKPGAGSPTMMAAMRSLSNTLDDYKKTKLGDPNVKFKIVDRTTGKVVLL